MPRPTPSHRLVRPLLAPGFAALVALATLDTGHALAAPVPHQDHVLVVVMENKSYDQVRTQPYTASLMTQGATLTQSYGVTHPSQPNYFALWAGDLLGVTVNTCPAPGTPFMAENLGHACEAAGLSWRAYSENLAVVGSASCSYDGNASSGLYTRKHDPWTNFGNLDHNRERPYSDLAIDIANAQLPNLVFVVPNNCHNSHNSTTAGCGVPDADNWLAANLPAMRAAVGPHGVVILTWDEDDSASNNHILTVFAGGDVMPGAVSSRTVDHYNLVRTICDALGLTPFAQAASAAPIDDIWMAPTATRAGSWGGLKIRYR